MIRYPQTKGEPFHAPQIQNSDPFPEGAAEWAQKRREGVGVNADFRN